MQILPTVVLWVLSIVLALFIGGFLKSYISKKGENLATHEDIEKLVDQVKAVTQTTKEIEARISGELWDRQKQWEMKRDVLFEAAKRVSAVLQTLKGLDSFIQTEVAHPEHKDELSWKQSKIDENTKWFRALEALDESRLVVGLICNKAVVEAIDEYRILTASIAARINKDDARIFGESVKIVLQLRDSLRDVIRKELGIG